MSGIDAGLNDAERRIMAALARATKEAAIDLQGRSQAVVPYDNGDLSRSAEVSTEVDGTTVRAAVSYDTPYAAVQHEDTTFRHQDGQQAKYLSEPLQSKAAKYLRYIEGEVEKALGG